MKAGLSSPEGIALLGDTLFVTNFGGNIVGAYDAKTGATINANLITGLDGPDGMVVSGHTLIVANWSSGTIGTYNAKTGAAINASFIAGIVVDGPQQIALLGRSLFVADETGFIAVYNAKTGKAINANLITGLGYVFGIAVKE